MRTKTGFLSAGLFSVVSVVGIAFASFQNRLTPPVAAGLLWVTMLFSSIVALARVFIAEEEAGTADLLRMLARPHAVFWGKALFNFVQMVITAAVISLLFFVLTGQPLNHWGIYLSALFGGCASLSGAVTLCGAMVAQATNRSSLAGAIGLPLLLPLIALGIGAFRYCLGAQGAAQATTSAIGLIGYAVAVFAIGPWLFAAFWKQ